MNTNMRIGRQAETGFTFVELAIALVIFGVLGAFGSPKVVEMENNAKSAAAVAAAGTLTSYSAINFSKSLNSKDTFIAVTGSAPGDALIAAIPTWDPSVKVVAQGECTATGASVDVTLSHTGAAASSKAVATVVCTG